MELFGALLGLAVVTQIMIIVIGAIAFPAFWIWMLIDSILREEAAYPGRSSSEKILWVVGMVVLQPAAIVYFFVVWRAGRKTATVSATRAAATA